MVVWNPGDKKWLLSPGFHLAIYSLQFIYNLARQTRQKSNYMDI